jgi:hypothetical protein
VPLPIIIIILDLILTHPQHKLLLQKLVRVWRARALGSRVPAPAQGTRVYGAIRGAGAEDALVIGHVVPSVPQGPHWALILRVEPTRVQRSATREACLCGNLKQGSCGSG